MIDFKANRIALAGIGLAVLVITLGVVWLAAGRASTAPPVVSAPALSPEQEAMRQMQGESRLGANQGAAARDVGEGPRRR
jgi:hypothetical protein